MTMKKGILRKAVSAVLALSLVIALMPAMFASAAEIGDKVTLGFSFSLYEKYEETGITDTNLDGTDKISEKLSNYFSSEGYSRNWKFFRTNWTNTGDKPGLSTGNGLYFRGGSACMTKWFAIKVKGFEKGTYSVNLHSSPIRGCVWGIYLLDDSTYGGTDVTAEEITAAIENMSAGVTKIGEADLFGEASAHYTVQDSNESAKTKLTTSATNINFGSAKLDGGENQEYILVFRAEKDGVLDSDESYKDGNSNRKSEAYISMYGLSFTKTTEAKYSDVFGDHAAFIEHTDDGNANLYLISAVDSVKYSKVGFMLGEEALETTMVYDSLTLPAKKVTDTSGTMEATEVSYTAADFGLDSGFLYVVKKTLSEGFTGQTINFKPYAVNVDGETTIEGSTYRATVSGGNQ